MFKMFSTMTLFGLLAVSAAHAQSSQPVQAKIPFAFSVQNTAFGAGKYQLTYSSTSQILAIRGLGQKSGGVFTIAQPVAGADSPARLVFNCYGGSCYLRQVWSGLTTTGLRVPQPKQDRNIAFLTRVVSVTVAAK